MRRHRFSPGILIIACVSHAALRAGSDRELADALDASRLDGSFVLLAIARGSDLREVREALGEPGSLQSMPSFRHVVASLEASPSLAIRFGAEALPLFVLLDASGREVGREAGARSPAAMVRALRCLGETARQTAAGRERFETNAEDPEALYWMATSCWSRGEVERAARIYRRVLKARPDPERLRSELRHSARERVVEYLMECSRLKEAEAILEEADAEAIPGRHGDWVALHLALVRRRRGAIREAAAVLEARIRRPDGAVVSERLAFTLAQLKLESGKELEALDVFREIEARDPHSLYGRRARRWLRERGAPARASSSQKLETEMRPGRRST